MIRITQPLLAAALFVLGSTFALPSAAQLATNVQCDGCIQSTDIQDRSIKTKDIANKTINNQHLKESSVGFSKLGNGVQGRINNLEAAVNGSLIIQNNVQQQEQNVSSGNSFNITATCVFGYTLTGGGIQEDSNFDGMHLWQSSPNNTGTAWNCRGRNPTDSSMSITCYALCGRLGFN